VTDPESNGDVALQDIDVEEDELSLAEDGEPALPSADADDLELDVEPAAPVDDRIAPTAIALDPDIEARLRRLEEAERARDRRRVRRKVKAASGGAGLAATVPVVLQLAGALHVSPEIASAIAAGAALLGAFAAGWSTPEREPSLPPQT
jgi:hypothetical protein